MQFIASVFRYVPAFLLSLSLTACSHVTFWGKTRNQSTLTSSGPTDPPAFRIYVDYLGDIYPNGAANSQSEPCTKLSFAKYPAQPAAPKSCKHLTAAAFETSWRQEQLQRWTNAGRAIAASVPPGAPVVVLLHGFVVNDASKEYATAKQAVWAAYHANFPGAPVPVFVEVHWDGRKPGALRFGRRQWGSAQYTAPLVGLKLRALLKQIPAATPIRILTHSSGAIVAASLLGDATAVLPRAITARCAIGVPAGATHWCGEVKPNDPGWVRDYDLYAAAANGSSADYPIPQHADLRVGMLAAATPAQSLTGNRVFRGGVLAPHATLIFGLNPQDRTINKYALGAERLGVTVMGTGGKMFVNYNFVKAELGTRTSPISVYGYDFRKGTNHCANSKHAFSCYLARQQFAPFLKRLLNIPGPPDDFAGPLAP